MNRTMINIISPTDKTLRVSSRHNHIFSTDVQSGRNHTGRGREISSEAVYYKDYGAY